MAAVERTPGLALLARPDMTALAIVAEAGSAVNILAVADRLEARCGHIYIMY